MKISQRVFLIAAVSLLLGACGKTQKDLERADKNLEIQRAENRKMNDENLALKRRLENVQGTANHAWVFGSFFLSYDKAKAECEQLGYSVPSASQMSEFEASNPGTVEKLENFGLDGTRMPLHILDVTTDVESGMALCVKPNTKE